MVTEAAPSNPKDAEVEYEGTSESLWKRGIKYQFILMQKKKYTPSYFNMHFPWIF